jgi:peptidoglycan L-alanyl-D-glutamate endopeptidase CwlK
MTTAASTVHRDLSELAPRFRDAVQVAIERCRMQDLHAFVYEAYRSLELQQVYYARGRTQVPPSQVVTNARSNLYSWHGFGLAVDVIHETREWDVPEEWFAEVAANFRVAGCRWGGEWKMKDLPHFQWGLCKPSPSDRARALMAAGGRQAVWDAVGAT